MLLGEDLPTTSLNDQCRCHQFMDHLKGYHCYTSSYTNDTKKMHEQLGLAAHHRLPVCMCALNPCCGHRCSKMMKGSMVRCHLCQSKSDKKTHFRCQDLSAIVTTTSGCVIGKLSFKEYTLNTSILFHLLFHYRKQHYGEKNIVCILLKGFA